MQKAFAILILFLLSVFCKAQETYEIMFSDNYPPYNYIDESGELVGFNIDLLRAIDALYDRDIRIQSGDWQSINEALDKGEIDAIGGANYPGSPDAQYIFSRSSISTSHCFLYNTKYHRNFSLELLRSEKNPLIAMWHNDVLIRYIQSINPSVRFLFVSSYEELVQQLDRTDVTCILGQRVRSMYYASKLDMSYVRPLPHRILERNMGFKVANSSPELAHLLNNGLEVILANGEYQRIYDKWITDYNKNYNDWQYYLKYVLFIWVLIMGLLLILVTINRILKSRIRVKTKDLQDQLEINSHMMIELERQKQKAEESDKMKSAFLANMSHEIRTPMNGILGFAELLLTEEHDDDMQNHFLGIIQQSGNRMLGTINNIIDVSKLESGMEHMHVEQVDIKGILTELVDFFTPEATGKGLELKLTKKSDTLKGPFFSDEYKLNSILTNLVKNAMKFTKEGYVEVTYALKDTQVEFWVNDTGIGIDAAKQSTIFNHFVQADISHSSGFEGSGLGLSISKAYVVLLKGDIRLNSELGKGSSFYVRIPNEIH